MSRLPSPLAFLQIYIQREIGRAGGGEREKEIIYIYI
jgi:hypothetical protein